MKNATVLAKVPNEKFGFQISLILDREATKEIIYKDSILRYIKTVDIGNRPGELSG